MNASTALVRLTGRTPAPVRVIHLQSRLREEALDSAAFTPRIWLEALESQFALEPLELWRRLGSER